MRAASALDRVLTTSSTVIALPTARSVAVWQDFVLRPSISTVRATQKRAPQPNFVPCKPTTVLRTHGSGVFACLP